METVLQDMVRWMIGFLLVSAVYLAVGLWAIRRFRRWREGKRAVPSPPENEAQDRGGSDSAVPPELPGESDAV